MNCTPTGCQGTCQQGRLCQDSMLASSACLLLHRIPAPPKRIKPRSQWVSSGEVRGRAIAAVLGLCGVVYIAAAVLWHYIT